MYFPWSSENLSPFAKGSQAFYAALSETFFEGYVGKKDLAKTFNASITTNMEAAEVARTLSAAIFLEDQSILSDEPNRTNIQAYYYINRHADNSVLCTRFHRYLRDRGENLAKGNGCLVQVGYCLARQAKKLLRQLSSFR